MSETKLREYNLAFSRGNVDVERRGQEGQTLLSVPYDEAAAILLNHATQAAQIEALTESLAWAMGNLRPGLDDRCGVHEYYKARAAIAAVGEKK